MFRRSAYSRAMAADFSDIEHRLRDLERHLGRAGRRTTASAAQAADRIGDAVVSALNEIGDRFRGGGRSVGSEAARIGHEAARMGNDALRRLADEFERRPLVMLAVAAGVGFLVGVATQRR